MTEWHYNDSKHLKAWTSRRTYPAIHNGIFDAVSSLSRWDGGAIDVCCCYGLIGQRIRHHLGRPAMGVEGLQWQIDAALAAGIEIPLYRMMIAPDTIDAMGRLIRDFGAVTMVARRCLSEIFYPDQSFASEFGKVVIESGIKEIFLQGRAFSSRSTHPIPHTDAEVALMRIAGFTEARRVGQVSHMVVG